MAPQGSTTLKAAADFTADTDSDFDIDIDIDIDIETIACAPAAALIGRTQITAKGTPTESARPSSSPGTTPGPVAERDGFGTHEAACPAPALHKRSGPAHGRRPDLNGRRPHRRTALMTGPFGPCRRRRVPRCDGGGPDRGSPRRTDRGAPCTTPPPPPPPHGRAS